MTFIFWYKESIKLDYQQGNRACFKGSSTHLQVATNVHKRSSSDSSRHQKNTCNVLDCTSKFRIEKQKCSTNFLLFSLFSKGVVPTLLEKTN